MVTGSSREPHLSKTTRKDYFGWPAEELEKWLPALLDNMRFTDIRVKPATRQASATVSYDASALDLLATQNQKGRLVNAVFWE